MKKQLVVIGLISLLVCIGLSGCEEKSNKIYVTIMAKAWCVNENVTKQDIEFDFTKDDGEEYTLYSGWTQNGGYYYATSTVHYVISPGDFIDVWYYHPLFNATQTTETFTYENIHTLSDKSENGSMSADITAAFTNYSR